MERYYLITMTLLFAHQIDAAFWHEWDMFFLPGGIQGYVAFNLLAIPFLLHGYKQVVLGAPQAARFSYICAGLGALTFSIHSAFFGMGFPQFNLPVSLLVILMCLLSSAILFYKTRQKVDSVIATEYQVHP